MPASLAQNPIRSGGPTARALGVVQNYRTRYFPIIWVRFPPPVFCPPKMRLNCSRSGCSTNVGDNTAPPPSGACRADFGRLLHWILLYQYNAIPRLPIFYWTPKDNFCPPTGTRRVFPPGREPQRLGQTTAFDIAQFPLKLS